MVDQHPVPISALPELEVADLSEPTAIPVLYWPDGLAEPAVTGRVSMENLLLGLNVITDTWLEDVTAERVLAQTARAEAQAAQAAAETAETNAETAETNAETAQTAAAGSATAASGSATAASNSATAAQTAETNAETAETNAETARDAAAASAAAAATSETNAGNFATAAQTAETNAETAETNAETARDAAIAARDAALTAETNAETAETNAETAATNAGNSATAAGNSATAAQTAETNAETAQAAAESARDDAQAAAASLDLPVIVGGDAGKALIVKATEDGYEIAADEYQPRTSVLDNTTASFTTADETKLDGIAAGADVTATVLNATAKNPPIDADRVFQGDSTAGNAPVYSTWTQVKAFLKTYFDTLYEVSGVSATHAALTAAHGATGAVVGTTNTQTLTNKRITARIGTTASSATPTPDADAHDQYNVTAQAAAAAFGAPSGTPTDGQGLIIRIKDNGTARALTWNAIYRSIVTLPTTTVISKTLYVGFIYNAADSKWDCVAKAQEA